MLVFFAQKGFPLLPYLKFLPTFPNIVCFLYLCWSCASVSSVTVLSFCFVLYLRMNRLLSFQLACGSVWSIESKCGKLGSMRKRGTHGFLPPSLLPIASLAVAGKVLWLQVVFVGSSITKIPQSGGLNNNDSLSSEAWEFQDQSTSKFGIW